MLTTIGNCREISTCLVFDTHFWSFLHAFNQIITGRDEPLTNSYPALPRRQRGASRIGQADLEMQTTFALLAMLAAALPAAAFIPTSAGPFGPMSLSLKPSSCRRSLTSGLSMQASNDSTRRAFVAGMIAAPLLLADRCAPFIRKHPSPKAALKLQGGFRQRWISKFSLNPLVTRSPCNSNLCPRDTSSTSQGGGAGCPQGPIGPADPGRCASNHSRVSEGVHRLLQQWDLMVAGSRRKNA